METIKESKIFELLLYRFDYEYILPILEKYSTKHVTHPQEYLLRDEWYFSDDSTLFCYEDSQNNWTYTS